MFRNDPDWQWLCADMPPARPVRAEFLYDFSFVAIIFDLRVPGISSDGPADCADVLQNDMLQILGGSGPHG